MLLTVDKFQKQNIFTSCLHQIIPEKQGHLTNFGNIVEGI